MSNLWQKTFDFVNDPRFLWNAQARNRPLKRTTQLKTLKVALTIDVEQDYGSKGSGFARLDHFFLNYSKIINSKIATLFLQGIIIDKYKNYLKALLPNLEMGVHGFNHCGLWGDPVWFLNEKPLSEAEKVLELENSLEAFNRAKLPKPFSFRAPNLIINKQSLKLLAKFGFSIDSSTAVFRQLGKVEYMGNLTSIPVSNYALPEIKMVSGILGRDYHVLNMGNLIRLPSFYWQKRLKYFLENYNLNHLVFLCHSWDLDKELLAEFCAFLESNWEIKYLTMQELGRSL